MWDLDYLFIYSDNNNRRDPRHSAETKHHNKKITSYKGNI